jgi:translation initiation factor IF-3
MIRVPQVRLIGDDGNQIGVVSRDEALKIAQERDLDLVEVAAEARPPVCRILDYSKYKYEQEQKQKAARRHQKQVHVREIKLRPKIATNDYETKKGHVRRFLDGDNKVKVTIMFRGREMAHPERGEALLMRLAEDVQDLGVIEQRPNQDGRNMTMMLGPVKKKEVHPAEGGQPPSGVANGEAPAEAQPEAPVPEKQPEAPAAEQQAEAPAPEKQPEAPAAEQAAKKAEAPAQKAEAPAPAQAGAKA